MFDNTANIQMMIILSWQHPWRAGHHQAQVYLHIYKNNNINQFSHLMSTLCCLWLNCAHSMRIYIWFLWNWGCKPTFWRCRVTMHELNFRSCNVNNVCIFGSYIYKGVLWHHKCSFPLYPIISNTKGNIVYSLTIFCMMLAYMKTEEVSKHWCSKHQKYWTLNR